MHLIQKNSPIPYYQQLADLLRNEIRTNQPGSGGSYALPSENELAELHGITRTTVRHALDVLEREGRIYRIKGKGAFAPTHRVEPEPPRLVSTTELMEERGWALTTWFISLIQMPAPAHITSALELGPEETIYELKRLQVVEDIPLSLQTAYLPVHLCPRLEDNDLTESLYRLLEIRYGLRLWTGQETLRARAAGPSEARLLQVRPGTPVMVSQRVSYASTGIPVEYLEAIWRGDRYDFTVTLARPTI
jgi:GntR family transcriptional regulator